ncbi:hypothetical protein BC939DRAFT_453362 [Gamsiella multidivaricata]|uniref:uncharacterized protein n=1 Tax=Gamsiella multidivaricata TaxID=101098 RepID=UPI00221F96DC|nr:uncharacterized protein BC939DRAFT_453362 [Gamsiella multidivaricata]KAI7822703.1 hypothetical protein BC939DRAFT_453362 [Gamsiella multidivaricata]
MKKSSEMVFTLGLSTLATSKLSFAAQPTSKSQLEHWPMHKAKIFCFHRSFSIHVPFLSVYKRTPPPEEHFDRKFSQDSGPGLDSFALGWTLFKHSSCHPSLSSSVIEEELRCGSYERKKK